MTKPRYASVVLDVDSTLCGIEGVDWIAGRRGDRVKALIAAVTERAMNGEIPLDAVFGERMNTVRPAAKDLEALAHAYQDSVAPDAPETIAKLRKAGVRLHLISGGFRQAILPLAKELGFAESDVNAVSVTVDAGGAYVGYESDSPMSRDGGKLEVVRGLRLPRPTLAVGDGNTDLAMKPGVDAFAAYVGFVRRETVVAGADAIFSTFSEIAEFVLG